ncbi:MAG: MBL fold metallo-hydrolase [Anaerolineae bacterium]|nr:MBL fold metallo-hydrolase [Anaerolineae bacterium]
MSNPALQQISEHVYWLPPAKPDRPSLCAVVGARHTLMLDSGASDAHAREFLDSLAALGGPAPDYVALTHWHWDHVFGAAEIGVPLIAHQETAQRLAVLADYDWSDAALNARVASGEEILACARDIKLELPEPRTVRIARPDVVFDQALDVHLGDVDCHIRHVGGDHASDSCVIHIQPDNVLFLGDCLYDAIYTPVRHFTHRRLFPLIEAILSFDADQFIEGHSPAVMTRSELVDLTNKMQHAARLVEQFGDDEQAALSHADQPTDEDTIEFVRAFIAGRSLE